MLMFPLQASSNGWDVEKALGNAAVISEAKNKQAQQSDNETSALAAALGLKSKAIIFGNPVERKKQIERNAAIHGYVKSTRSGAQIDRRMIFKTGSSELNTGTKKRIATLAKVYKMHPSEVQKILITGHTDAVGSKQNNTRLSNTRAQSVRQELISQGIPARKIFAKGYGEYHLLPNIPSTSAFNRRVEYSVIKR
jgi:outer membrane protein OmpA-like peptidoglycan-associated protein